VVRVDCGWGVILVRARPTASEICASPGNRWRHEGAPSDDPEDAGRLWGRLWGRVCPLMGVCTLIFAGAALEPRAPPRKLPPPPGRMALGVGAGADAPRGLAWGRIEVDGAS
jgi:hypothetical protein